MPETPPPFSPSPTSSPADDIDQAAAVADSPPASQDTASAGKDQGNQPSPATQKEAGNIPPAPAPAGPRLETFLSARTVSRGGDGRFGSPKASPPAIAAANTATEGKRTPPPSEKSAAAALLEDRRIAGLTDIPEHWGELPDNVSQGLELAWVQANRLKVVKETPRGGIKVDLSKARTPAPSWAAISWLETAIKTPTKFVELAAKQAAAGSDEAEFVRRERMAVGEIRALLEEMRG